MEQKNVFDGDAVARQAATGIRRDEALGFAGTQVRHRI
jgi:hypothetical protein